MYSFGPGSRGSDGKAWHQGHGFDSDADHQMQ